MVLALGEKKKETVNIELRQELSDFLAQRFMCKKNCSICWGTGIKVVLYPHGGALQYKPCTCLLLKKDTKNVKETDRSTKE